MAQKVRVVRTTTQQESQDAYLRDQVWPHYAALKAFIRRGLPLSTASVLAEPVIVGTEHVDWLSEAGGQPMPLASLPTDERQRVEQLLTDRLAALCELANRFPDEPAAQLLARVAQRGPENHLYAMNGQPIMVCWGGSAQTAGAAGVVAAPTSAIGPAAIASAGVVSGAAGTAASPAPAAIPARGAEESTSAAPDQTSAPSAVAAVPLAAGAGGVGRGMVFGCLGAVLLALLIAALLWFFAGDALRALFHPGSDLQPTPPVEQENTAPVVDDADRARWDALNSEQQALQDRIAAAQAELERRLKACPVPQKADLPTTLPQTLTPVPSQEDKPAVERPQAEIPPVEAPQVDPPASQAVMPEAKPLPPERQLPPREKQTPQEKPPTPSKPSQPPPSAGTPPGNGQSANRCPAPRKSYEAPELVILLDRSGSMKLRAGIPQSQVEDLYRRAMGGDPSALAQLNSLAGTGDNSRLGVAKDAVRGLVQTLPKDVDVGLVVFGQCTGAESFKFFSAPDRPRLLSLLQSITPQEGTPLARGLERAGNMVDGVSVPATVVVVTDGEDSCHGDPCAVAQALKQAKPNLTINVIDVNGQGEGACMATATGGKVYRMRSPTELEGLIQKASGETPVPPGCP